MPKPTGPKGGTSMFTAGGLRRIYVYVEPEAQQALRKLAFDRETSVSALVAEIISEYLDRQLKK